MILHTMGRVNPSPPARLQRFVERHPHAAGSLCGVVSAVLYTIANVGLRYVSDLDPALVAAVKAVPSLAVASLLIVWDGRRQMLKRGSVRVFAVLASAALIAQVGGNVGFQWALGVVGLALSAPLCLGTMIVTSTIAARLLLGEGVTPRTMLAILLLLGSITALSIGSQTAEADLGPHSGRLEASFGLFAGAVVACVAGVSYATMNVTIRRVVTGTLPISMTWMVVSGMGVVSLSILSLARIGTAGVAATSAGDWATMFLAGLFNAGAFFYLTKALQLVPVVHVNVINASQTALAAVAGVSIFQEPVTGWLIGGVLLSVVGVMLVQRAPHGPDAAPPPSPEPGPE